MTSLVAPIKLVRLKNGAEEEEGVVTTTMLLLRHLMETDAIGLYEIVQKARDANHTLWTGYEERLKALSLLQIDGGLHDSTRNVVLSATTGEGGDIRLCNPLEEVP